VAPGGPGGPSRAPRPRRPGSSGSPAAAFVSSGVLGDERADLQHRRLTPPIPQGSGGVVVSGLLAVAVQADDDGVDGVEVEQQGGQADDGQPGGAAATPAGGGAGVEVGREDRPADEGPGLLGVPAPVAAPGRLGPDGAGDDGEGPDGEAEGGRPGGEMG